MSTQSIRSAKAKTPAPNQSSTHTYRLFRLLKNNAAEQRAAHYTDRKMRVKAFAELFLTL
jgi:hypothetical protein